MDELLQHGKNPLWEVLFRENAHADFYRRYNSRKEVSAAKSGNNKTE